MTTVSPEKDVEEIRALAKEQGENGGAAGFYAILARATEMVEARNILHTSTVGEIMIGSLLREAGYEIMGSFDTGSGSTYAFLMATAKRFAPSE